MLGGLFENLVVMEALKSRYNCGESGEMVFYLDATGNEVDLLLPAGRRLHAIEIKAGATVNPDYFRGLATLARTFPDRLLGTSAQRLAGAALGTAGGKRGFCLKATALKDEVQPVDVVSTANRINPTA